jgi:hypothetical protein
MFCNANSPAMQVCLVRRSTLINTWLSYVSSFTWLKPGVNEISTQPFQLNMQLHFEVESVQFYFDLRRDYSRKSAAKAKQ